VPGVLPAAGLRDEMPPATAAVELLPIQDDWSVGSTGVAGGVFMTSQPNMRLLACLFCGVACLFSDVPLLLSILLQHTYANKSIRS
jgi:hypothetical protein